MKKAISIILALIMVCGMLTVSATASNAGFEDYVFTDNRGNQVIIPGGAASCATRVVSFTPGNPWTSRADAMNTDDILGAPDRQSNSYGQALTLGAGGVIVLEFDIYIVDGPGLDIYVFEVGTDVEATSVEVSDDLINWIYVGDARGSISGVDMEGKVPADGKYRYVRITDLKTSPSGTWPGADIDAVAGLNIQLIPDPTPPAPSITVSAGTGGSVSGGGTYQAGQTVTLTATPQAGYVFDGWYENGTRVSTNTTYTFTASASRNIEARFTQSQETVTVPPSFPNPHSSWASEELGRAFAENLVPPLLGDPNVDLREPISRVEFAGVVVKTFENLSGTSVNPVSGNPFTDTTDIYARMAYDVGLMVGTSANTFAPHTILNRETAATALTRVFKRWHFPGWTFATDGNFTLTYDRPAPFADDANISAWAKDSVYFMAANGIIQGTGNNIFAPRATANDPVGYANATREQALIIALRMVEGLK